jgi:serine/threonine kinase 32
LDEQGHVHLTDFNIAIHYVDRKLIFGVAGSMAYMAPEILAKKGYSYMIDWWSLGVCAYELTFGRRPFRGKTNSDLTHSIFKDLLRFPEDAQKRCSRAGIQAMKGVCIGMLT